MNVKVYVECGDEGDLKGRFRESFASLCRKLGLAGKLPRIIPCGSRNEAMQDFRRAIASPETGTKYLLLVDSESPCPLSDPWVHLLKDGGDHYSSPANATADQCHLMTQATEAWFVADRAALKKVYGKGFDEGPLPAPQNAELQSKADLQSALNRAAKSTKRQKYQKSHAPDIIGELDPATVGKHCPWAKRFFDHLQSACTAA